jgi:hypothetical protein
MPGDRRNKTVDDTPIFECISMIAIAVGQTMTKYMDALLDPIFACGLSDALTQALVDMAHYIPPAKPTIQEKLLDLLSTVLCGRPFQPLGSPQRNTLSPSFLRTYREGQPGETTDAEIALALQTLGNFDFSGKSHQREVCTMQDKQQQWTDGMEYIVREGKKLGKNSTLVYDQREIGMNLYEDIFHRSKNRGEVTNSNYILLAGYVLNEFVHDVAIHYVEHDSPTIRKAACLTCCQLFVKDPILMQTSRHAGHIVSGVIDKLLAVAVADPGKASHFWAL